MFEYNNVEVSEMASRRYELTDEQWDKILEHLVKVTRQKAGLSENPTKALIDSQSVKTTGAVEQKGFDAGKKRKE